MNAAWFKNQHEFGGPDMGPPLLLPGSDMRSERKPAEIAVVGVGAARQTANLKSSALKSDLSMSSNVSVLPPP